MIKLLLLMLALPVLHAQTFIKLTTDTEVRDSFPFFGKNYNGIFVKKTDSGVAFCFNGLYEAGSTQDCFIVTPSETITSMTYAVGWPVNEGEMKTYLQDFSSTGASALRFSLKMGDQSAFIDFYKNKPRGAVILTIPARVRVGTRWNVGGNEIGQEILNSNKGLDFSSCRSTDGSIITLGSDKTVDCTKETCSSSGEKVSTKLCGADEHCIDNQCQVKLTCTLTGPTLIDVKGNTATIRDRCKYTVLESQLLSDLTLSATYMERGREDVSFLDAILIKVGQSTYSFKQGGTVELNGKKVTIPNQGLRAGKLQLYKTDTWVFALFTDKGFIVSISFDGITAQILITGQGGQNPQLTKFCANALADVTPFKVVADGCDSVKTQDPDPSIQCPTVKQQCSVLRSSTFSSCQSLLSPDPYIKVCSDTLCKYSDTDKLLCRFVGAYSTACYILFRKAISGWQDSLACPASPKFFCKDKTCTNDEYCGLAPGGTGYQCKCKTSFASSYRTENTLGDGATCDAGSGSASLINCLLLEKGIDYTTLHLNDKTCVGTLSNGKVLFEFSKNKLCDTEVKEEGNALVYENRIKTGTSTELIVRQDEVNIPFKCTYIKPDLQKVSIKVTSNSVVTGLEVGAYQYTLQMATFSDEGLTTPLKTATLNQKAWVSLATSLDGNVAALVVESCWATKEADPNSDPKYFLITKGCPNTKDDTVKIKENGKGSSSVFSFNIFQFSAGSDDVYLNCEVKLCSKTGKSCVPTCPANRRRRSISFMSESPALISMSWTS